ncbi:MGMT family protein [Pontibacillus sp. HMF3514]|uniref:MGMT family protein n=1 Tax=Pontibacillus sp. HMF3514 TaxID=2692425 RepID=UPI0013205069|nr:MGMT family protein [Pontibacillus sp. HMF3514]QHE54312.1 DNA methyltransferase [Pontibacillus sp. HMF3514]
MKPFTESVINIIRDIPEGKVMSYGQIAKHAGSPRGARQVVRILHTMSSKYRLPWHRVVNAKGEIAIKDEEGSFEQKQRLEDEEVVFVSEYKVDMRESRYEPE